jgi:hypothetical protein
MRELAICSTTLLGHLARLREELRHDLSFGITHGVNL